MNTFLKDLENLYQTVFNEAMLRYLGRPLNEDDEIQIVVSKIYPNTNEVLLNEALIGNIKTVFPTPPETKISVIFDFV